MGHNMLISTVEPYATKEVVILEVYLNGQTSPNDLEPN
jgi:hypothetical protein